MRIFLAGGTGVIGRRLVPGLIAAGHELVVLARDPQRAAAAAELGAEVVQGDALSAADMTAVVAAAEPELIMHQLTDLSERSSQANAQLRIDGTRNLVQAAIAADVGAIVLQSIAWVYAPGTGPATEDVALDLGAEDPARRLTVEAVAQMEASAAGLERCVTLRNGLFYGPGTWYAPGAAMAEAAYAGSLRLGPDITSFVHVDDAAAAAVQAVNWPGGTYNVVDDEPAAAEDWVPAFCEATGAPAPNEADTEAHGWARGAANTRARECGWVPAYPSWRLGFAADMSAVGADSSGRAGSSSNAA
jgi:nucleoside-diphosphate-sugar epimerase